MIYMRKIKWVDVYETIMKQKKELQDELKKIEQTSLKDKKISYEYYVIFKHTTQIKLETLDQLLKEFDKIDTLKGGE